MQYVNFREYKIADFLREYHNLIDVLSPLFLKFQKGIVELQTTPLYFVFFSSSSGFGLPDQLVESLNTFDYIDLNVPRRICLFNDEFPIFEDEFRANFFQACYNGTQCKNLSQNTREFLNLIFKEDQSHFSCPNTNQIEKDYKSLVTEICLIPEIEFDAFRCKYERILIGVILFS